MKVESHYELTREFPTEILSQDYYESAHRSPAPAMPIGYSVLEHLKDFEINPDVDSKLTRTLVKQQVYDFMNVYRHASRVLPKWDGQINLRVIGSSLGSQGAEFFSMALNQLSLMTDMNVSLHKELKVDSQSDHSNACYNEGDTNALVIFVDGKDQICLDDEIGDALRAVGKDPVEVYNRIDQNCINNKQATEYRTLRYGTEGVTFFLYIVDISWLHKAALGEEEKAKAMYSQCLHTGFRLFSLQDGVSDSIKYSFMNHKYFWRNMQTLSPVDSAFLSILYSDGMQKKRSKYNATRYVAHKIWKALKPEI